MTFQFVFAAPLVGHSYGPRLRQGAAVGGVPMTATAPRFLFAVSPLGFPYGSPEPTRTAIFIPAHGGRLRVLFDISETFVNPRGL